MIYKTLWRVRVSATLLISFWHDVRDLCVAIAAASDLYTDRDRSTAVESLVSRETGRDDLLSRLLQSLPVPSHSVRISGQRRHTVIDSTLADSVY